MDQQRRMIMFVAMSLGVLIGYQTFVLPVFFPELFRPPVVDPAEAELQVDLDRPVDALLPANVPSAAQPSHSAAQPTAALAEHPARSVVLGSIDPASGFFLEVELTSVGGAVERITLNDPRYPELSRRGTPLQLVGHDPSVSGKTLANRMPVFDGQLNGKTLEQVSWETVEATEESVMFRLTSPDGQVRISKRYELPRVPQETSASRELRDSKVDPYQLRMSFTVENLGAAPIKYDYTLRGPSSLPLEDPENTYKFRDVRMGFLSETGGVDASLLTAATAVSQEKDNGIEVWKRPIRYMGIDTQYFAALLMPVQDQLTQRTIAASQAEIVRTLRKPEHSDLSVLVTSVERNLPAGGSSTDDYLLFAGPKRELLLNQLGAADVLDYGWFAPLVKLMLSLLGMFHSLGLGYGVAIIGLTCLVRGLMFPISRHQLQNMEKVKELQPRLKELQGKYHKDPSKLTPEEMQLLRDVNLKTLGGCLPVLLQLPIFFALYRSLSVSVDLRMAPMHFFGKWIDNLAAPDALFPLGFRVPWLEWDVFNLLPILTVILFYVQQKLTMPPPVDAEQALQYKMMNGMMIVMGAMFYRVPAGLCVYFIASSVWGLIERWLLKRLAASSAASKATSGATVVAAPAKGTAPAVSVSKSSSAPAARAADASSTAAAPAPNSLKEMWGKLQQMADKPATATRIENPPRPEKPNRKPKRR
jgi:YidC/Oxa1 family membrane protein insertase